METIDKEVNPVEIEEKLGGVLSLTQIATDGTILWGLTTDGRVVWRYAYAEKGKKGIGYDKWAYSGMQV